MGKQLQGRSNPDQPISHGRKSVPGGVQPTNLKDHGHTVINPKLPDEDFPEAVRLAQAKFDKHRPGVVVGSNLGGPSP